MPERIKALREPYTPEVTGTDVQAAALQYVRKISGIRTPAAHNGASDAAVATRTLLDQLVVRGAAAPRGGQAAASAGATVSGAHRER